MPELEFSYVTEAGAGARAIRWFTHSDFSHAEVIFPDGRRYGARSDSLPLPGVQFRSLTYAKFSKDWRIMVPVTVEQAQTFYTFLLAQYCKPYDSHGLFSSFLFSRPDPWRDSKEWWCSELTAAAKEAAGIAEFHTPASRITPNDDFIVTAAIPGAEVIKVVP